MGSSLQDKYSYLQEIETRYTAQELQSWTNGHIRLPIYGTIAFLLMISILPRIMRSYKPMDLRSLLFFWNMGLAIFSLFASIRMIEQVRSEMSSGLTSSSVRKNICSLGTDNVSSLWMYLYTMSKFIQFGDTFFLIVRKKRLTFLHLWHHGVVLGFMWLQFSSGAPALKYFMLMNVIIHAMMYFYYAVQCLGIQVHKSIAMSITAIQIIQMVIGLLTQYMSYHYLVSGYTCFRNDWAAASALIVYGSCLYLFSTFFVDKYLTSPVDMNQNVRAKAQ